MRGVGGPLLSIGDLLNDVGDSNSDASPRKLHHHTSSSPSSPISTPIRTPHSFDLTKLFQENYKELNEALAGTDHSWTAQTLKLCTALETANKLVQSTNSNVGVLSEKVEELEKVVKRADSAIASARAVHASLSEKEEKLAGNHNVK
ncbi:uncharacterized protein LOC125423005 [Ziziphus jujuba]|uniref:Uncharacterized protein LOC125423005 n=1 Tax=Ziziphus jujuba TaxID=326968 RepID=A0ABM4A861_ZIZJJ|nr:uncharacterized protein LOC125423005 [Ziziphus jujuba]XP_060672927.1 uncharacterized protein LOC125423005 [Ziziphus jujuba]